MHSMHIFIMQEDLQCLLLLTTIGYSETAKTVNTYGMEWNLYCVLTHQMHDLITRTQLNHKTNYGYGLRLIRLTQFSHLIGFLSQQSKLSRNSFCVHGFYSFTVNYLAITDRSWSAFSQFLFIKFTCSDLY